MARSNEASRPFHLFVTHVDGEGHFLKICGQPDQQSSMMVESLFKSATENLEKGIGAVPPAAITEGIVCAAKYKDGKYYRAKIINTSNLATGLVGVQFIDYGNKDIISLSTIRFLDSYDPMFFQLRGQAADYYLSRIIHPSGRWEEPLVLKLQSLLCYAEYPATIEAHTHTYPIISIQFKGNDLSSHLVANRFGIAIPTTKQEVLLLQLTSENQQQLAWSPSYLTEAPTFTEHVPFLINQNFPNPASAMRLNQNVPVPFNGTSIAAPSSISQRLLVSGNKTARNIVNLRAPVRQPQHLVANSTSGIAMTTPPSTPVVNKTPSPKKSITYKSRLLEMNSQHKVFVSFAEEGPELFAVQLVADAKRLQDMMDEINRRPHSSLTEPPMIGTVCLGRMSGDRIICRAIVMNLSGSQCKLFFVDFGDTEMVSYYDIFDIPEEFVKPNVFAMRFCLSGVKKLERGPYLNEAFKQLVNGKVMTLKVVAPEGPPLIQYGELFLDNTNVLEMLMTNMKDKLQFKWLEMLPMDSRLSVLVSYVDSCVKFYVQLSDKIDDLHMVMDAVKVHCENISSPGPLPVGAVCCARFPDDDKWYRARVRQVNGSKIVVAYVDYGNEQEVNASDLRTITPDLLRLPAQAMKCALKGFESKPVETKTSNQLEMIALEKTLMAHVVGTLSSDTMLVTLVDDTVSPPLDVARRMNQLSQPRSNVENKVTTPVRKDAPDVFSSPEGSIQDDRKKGFRREKSFKDDRRSPRDASDDFGQRGGSFRSRDQKENFDRSGTGRHSEKFGGKPDRGDRDQKENFDRSGPGRHSEKFGGKPDRGDRRGGKPWESQSHASAAPAPVSAADDEWEEAPAPQAARPPRDARDPRPARDNREMHRRKPRSDNQDKAQQRGAWKKESCGVGKRIKQAAEAASLDAQGPKPSVQDRLKRDRYNQDDSNTEDRGNRNFRDNRPERRDNRPERRDNWGDKKENWGEKKESWGEKKDSWGEKEGFQKREFRDNRGERGGHRSNFTPRDRAERADRSFGSDRSDKSYRSQDNNGRAPPYKSRSRFTQVQYKELESPVSLDTPFAEPSVESGAQHEVSVTWIISPDSFHTQILSLQPKFLEMMHSIPELYKGVKSYNGDVTVGSSVLARYPADGVLYRATVVAVQPFAKFIVRYVDFGNKQLVDAKDIWQLDNQLMELPKMAVHCSLIGVAPAEGEWKANPEIDLCFNAPRYQCVFQECVDDVYKVSLWNNGVSVADTLVEKNLAVTSGLQSSVTLKDEAIDLTIIVGQQILCRVTHVESFEKFYVQLDMDKADLVESAIANIDMEKLVPLAAESLTENIHCTVKHEGKVYRAIITEAADPANVRAALPDYGTTITTQLDNLMILPSELSVYYYQALECCLNNYTAEAKTLVTLEELKEKLTGNKVIVYINSVEEIKLVTTLYKTTGEKVAIFEPDEGAYDEVVPLCLRAVFNYNFGVAYVAHVGSLNELYLQRSADGDRIAQLLDDLYKFYEEGTPEPLAAFEADGLCAAKSSDGNWYRATIVSAEEAVVKVQFLDYGNSETLPKDSLKNLDPKFYEPCALALVASLGLIALLEDTVTKLTEWVNEKEVQVTLAFGSDGWLASLHLDGVDLSMKLVNEKFATPQIAPNEEEVTEQKEERTEAEPVSLPEGCTQVYISHIDTPGHFWLQMVDKVDKIEEIQAELQANADSYVDIENREMGTMCIAKYLADDQWYRAEILDADSDITTVRFIDYGNTDVLDNQPGLIKVIPDNLKEVERYAIKSSVNAVPTGTGQWSEPASDYFTQLVGDLSVPVDALIVLKDVTTYVDIFVNNQNLTDKLVSEGHASRSEENDCGDLPSCFASHVNSPSEFWIQLETAAPELQAMEAAMVDAENFPPLEDKEEGVICAAKYPEDGAWYRAQVIVDGSEGTEVLFMDYGNASITNELRSLPEELKHKPALSRKCALQKPRDIKSWSRKSEVKFNELAAEGATIFNVQFIASGDISIVELYLEGKSVTEELVGLCEEQPTAERPIPVGQDIRSNGKICYVNTHDEFYIHLENKIPDIDNITESLSGAADYESINELKVGSVCAAFWSEDNQWYRGRILEFCDVGYHVQFIDYGNRAKCEEFRQLPDNLALMEPMAKCCQLSPFTEDPALLEVAKSKLNDFAAEDTTFQIEFLDSLKEPYLVKLFLNGEDFSCIVRTEANGDINCQEDENAEPSETIKSVVKSNANDESLEESNSGNDSKNTDKLEKANIEHEVKASDPHATEKNVVEEDKIEYPNTVQECKDKDEKVIENTKNENSTEDIKIEELKEESVVVEENIIMKTVEIENTKNEDSTEDIKIADLKEESVVVEDNMKTVDENLDESIDSGNTVIENKSFEDKFDDAIDTTDEITNDKVEETSNDNVLPTSEADTSSETLENSNDTIKTSEREESKDSIITDTGYTSDGDEKPVNKCSPVKTNVSLVDRIAKDEEKMDHTIKKQSEVTPDKTES